MMNRQGAVPQTLRGMPGSFGSQQQPQQQHQQQQQQQQQPGRSVSSRLPNGKLAGNTNSGWAFGGGGAPMGNANFQNQTRQMGGNLSFAQSLSGSQPAAPLDMSEFPSLSNNSQIGNVSSSMWSQAGSRNVSAPVQRNQPTPLSSQHTGQAGQDELYNSNSSRVASTQGSLRFGNQSSAQAAPSSVDDFPPLNRTVNGEERSASLMSSLGISTQGSSTPGLSGNRGNGLLNALSANNRSTDSRSQASISGSALLRQGTEDEGRLRQAERLSKSLADGALQDTEGHPPDGESHGKSKDEAIGTVDPLSGMPAADKWGIKGLRTLMHNYPDYHAMVLGMDPSSLGLDMSSQDLISTQVYSLFDENMPKPTVHASKFRLPDCYNVTNVQPIETKIQSFNEETLFWIFYSCPADVKQQMAAVELHSRNWRWHRKLQLWLTKDEHMTPQILGPSHERGYYIVWDAIHWQKDRKEITLHYSDLDTGMNQGPV